MIYVNDFIDSLHLHDAWYNNTALNNVEYTYIDPSGKMRNSRIDLWLTSDSVRSITDSCEITQSPSPDHKAVVLQVALNDKIRGRGYWKLNVSLLEDVKLLS